MQRGAKQTTIRVLANVSGSVFPLYGNKINHKPIANDPAQRPQMGIVLAERFVARRRGAVGVCSRSMGSGWPVILVQPCI